ncbi:peroxisomal membrane protein PMP22-like [Pyrus ussuriensis x Pyrus communis]|uniref:Peroxisomal membrane protein PMP22-like n=1 Tax=Pyrus ussuriensis x Pyrus communis TaxID=2448454 RepID=A0A5N5GCT1_9ROSA|nr:peroxisomal membrane protein PMP22-like [Pyrus ussuriensis x Pyrus communis]
MDVVASLGNSTCAKLDSRLVYCFRLVNVFLVIKTICQGEPEGTWILLCKVLSLQCIMDMSSDEDHSSSFLSFVDGFIVDWFLDGNSKTLCSKMELHILNPLQADARGKPKSLWDVRKPQPQLGFRFGLGRGRSFVPEERQNFNFNFLEGAPVDFFEGEAEIEFSPKQRWPTSYTWRSGETGLVLLNATTQMFWASRADFSDAYWTRCSTERSAVAGTPSIAAELAMPGCFSPSVRFAVAIASNPAPSASSTAPSSLFGTPHGQPQRLVG